MTVNLNNLFGQQAEPIPVESTLERLRKYGWFGDPTAVALVDVLKLSEAERTEAVKLFQQYFGLKDDGVIGEHTESLLWQPRCSFPDIQFAGDCKWNHGWGQMPGAIAYWHTDEAVPGMSRDDTFAAFDVGCENWTEVCGIRFERVNSKGEANIWAEWHKIDKRGGTLAWSYLVPCGNGRTTKLEQRYDTSERWNFDFFASTVCHEVGHALGWSHIADTGSIMNPYITNLTKPGPKDIARAVDYYGQPSGQPAPPKPVPPTSSGIPFNMVGADGRTLGTGVWGGSGNEIF